MVFRARIEGVLAALGRWHDALIALAKLPPGLVVILRLDLAAQHLPAPLIHHDREWQEGDLVARGIHQQAEIR